MGYFLKVSKAAIEPVARDHVHVAAAEEVQDGATLLAPCGRCVAAQFCFLTLLEVASHICYFRTEMTTIQLIVALHVAQQRLS